MKESRQIIYQINSMEELLLHFLILAILPNINVFAAVRQSAGRDCLRENWKVQNCWWLEVHIFGGTILYQSLLKVPSTGWQLSSSALLSCKARARALLSTPRTPDNCHYCWTKYLLELFGSTLP